MISQRTLLTIAALAFALAVTLGMLDHESESLVHLFTAERGNLVALALYTGFFTALGMCLTIAISRFRQRSQ